MTRDFSEGTLALMKFAPAPKPMDLDPTDWSSWQWQLKNRLIDEAQFSKYFELSEAERAGFQSMPRLFKVQSTPYYASLAKPHQADPIRRMIVPSQNELHLGGQQMADPLAERAHSPRPRLIHRYPDRLLFLITDTCSVYCRYCLRKHFTGLDEAFISAQDYQEALSYIRSHPGVREVILSGGDPLTVSDERLVKVVRDLREISSVEIIRLGTRMPVVCPMRTTDELIQKLKAFHPIVVMTHFNHPREVTKEAVEGLQKWVDNGFPVFNQMVLLRGVNNHPAIVQALSRRLLYCRVKPHYMFQMDPSRGSEHFRTTVDESLQIQRELWGRLSGLALPQLSLDIPGGGGKVGLTPNFLDSHSEGRRRFTGFDGLTGEYIDPEIRADADAEAPGEGVVADLEDYRDEWLRLRDQRYGK